MVVSISPTWVLVTPATVEFSALNFLVDRCTGTALVKEGKVYAISVDSVGSGYTKAPSVTINGDGSNAKATVRIVEGRDAVQMGVCTSEDATAATKFRFLAPVYMESNTYYAFVVKSPTSLNYTILTAKLVRTNSNRTEWCWNNLWVRCLCLRTVVSGPKTRHKMSPSDCLLTLFLTPPLTLF